MNTKPKMIVAGGSAYPRKLDFARFRAVADSVGALLLVDMAHISGLVAAGLHANPCEYADIVTIHHAQNFARTPQRHHSGEGEYGAAIDKRYSQATRAVRSCTSWRPRRFAFSKPAAGVPCYTAGTRQRPCARPRGCKEGFRVVSGGTDTHVCWWMLSRKASRQGSRASSRPRAHHGEQERDSVRRQAAEPERYPFGKSGGHHARHEKSGNAPHRSVDRRSVAPQPEGRGQDCPGPPRGPRFGGAVPAVPLASAILGSSAQPPQPGSGP